MRPSRVLISTAACLVSACSGATTRFYTLESIAPRSGPALTYTGVPVRIDAVHIPASLDRPELVRDDGGGRFTVSDNDHWAAPVGELFRRVLTQDLAARLPAGRVIYPDTPKPSGSAGMVVDILSISPSGDRVTMDASWTLVATLPPGAKLPEASRQRTLRLTTQALGTGVGSDATVLSAFADQMAATIAEDLLSSEH